MSNYGAIKHFTDVEAWKLATRVRQAIYKIVKTLPPEKKICSGHTNEKGCYIFDCEYCRGIWSFSLPGKYPLLPSKSRLIV